jgi:hypothetical protein
MFDQRGMLPCLLVCSKLAERVYVVNFENISNLCISADVEVDADEAFAKFSWYVNLYAVPRLPSIVPDGRVLT